MTIITVHTMSTKLAVLALGNTCAGEMKPTSATLGLFAKFPAEIENDIIERFIALDPIPHLSLITRILKTVRKDWATRLCKVVGPLRIDKHLDDQVLNFLDANKNATEALVIHYNCSIERTALKHIELHQIWLVLLVHTTNKRKCTS